MITLRIESFQVFIVLADTLKQINRVEEEIHTTERDKALCESKLANPPANLQTLNRLTEEYHALAARLEALMSKWEDLAWALQEAGPEE